MEAAYSDYVTKRFKTQHASTACIVLWALARNVTLSCLASNGKRKAQAAEQAARADLKKKIGLRVSDAEIVAGMLRGYVTLRTSHVSRHSPWHV